MRALLWSLTLLLVGLPTSAFAQAGGGIGGTVVQPLGQPNTFQTLQGPGAAASATYGTIGSPGIAGGFLGVGQSQLMPGQGPVTTQQYAPSGVDARGEMGAGFVGRSYLDLAPFAVPQSRSARADGWRFRRHDGLWWYYTPQRTWAVWQANRWVAYQRGALYARDRMARLPQTQVTTGYRRNYLGTGMYSGQR